MLDDDRGYHTTVIWLLLFLALPAVELVLLIEVGRRIGSLETVGLIILTGVIGASLTRSQGLGLLRRVRDDLEAGELPAGALLDGALILLAGALLITPGFITDATGFLLLTPAVRAWLRLLARQYFLQRLRRDGTFVIWRRR